jgi:prepilin-type N-terminal cleavage/methylation domain-containing protein
MRNWRLGGQIVMTRYGLNSSKAFTLVELLVVIAIVGILAAMLIPTLGAAKAKSQRTVCMNDLRQINLGLRLYSDDSSDYVPKTPHTNAVASMQNIVDYTGFKEVMKHNVGLRGPPSPQDKIFACPADTFYYDPGYVPLGFHEQAFTDYSSYGFNAGTADPVLGHTPGIAGLKISSVRDPVKTILVMELPALFPYSWHQRKVSISQFNDAKNMTSFVDGHVNFIKIYWNTNQVVRGGASYVTDAMDYDPPGGYDYKWSAD